jgi:hypothetical protein
MIRKDDIALLGRHTLHVEKAAGPYGVKRKRQ